MVEQQAAGRAILPIAALDARVEDRPDDQAVADLTDSWTYARLRREAHRVALSLAEAGVGPGDRVTLQMPNRLALVASYYACFELSATACPLNTRWTAHETEAVLRRLSPRVHVSDEHVVPMSRAGMVGAPRVPVDEAPAVLLGTSGTTGAHKLVVHTARTLAACVDMLVADLRGPERLAICPLPLVHAGGLIANLLAYVRLGSPLLLLDRPDPAELLDIVAQRGGSYVSFLPALLMSAVETQAAQPRDLSGLARCVVSGDALSEDAHREAERVLDAEVRQVWAATEAMGSFTYGRRPGPRSRPAAGSDVRLVDADGGDADAGDANDGVGEMLVRGPNVSPGYWADDGRVVDSPRDGWFRSGDLFRRESCDGHDEFRFLGRMKDLIVRAGSNISPLEVEAALERHPSVGGALVVGMPDPRLGQRVEALVEPAPPRDPENSRSDSSGRFRDDITLIAAEIKDFVAGTLAAYKIPERIRIVGTLPRSAGSKLDRRAARTLLSRRGGDG